MNNVQPVTIYHNPVCSNSRGALQILRDRGIDHVVVEYLQQPLSRADFESILAMLSGDPTELVRQDKRFKELALDAGAYATPAQVVALLLEHPELMQRPVIVSRGKAVIARPPEKLAELLG